MGTKTNPGPYDCLAAAGDDEPVFILLARDANAPAAVIAWAMGRLQSIARIARPIADVDQVAEALGLARQMLAWRAAHPRPPSPAAPLPERLLDKGALDRVINRLDEIAAGL